MAMLVAVSIMLGYFIRIRGLIPAAPFLTFDAKDVCILIGGFIFGPLAALMMSIVLALLEMVTISQSGPIGAFMNALSSAALTCTASYVYMKNKSAKGAVIGLILGSLVATAAMIAWNIILIPIYMPTVTREASLNLILPAILPFNLIKNGLNAGVTMLVYKHVTRALKAAKVYPEINNNAESDKFKLSIGVIIVAVIIISTALLTLWIL